MSVIIGTIEKKETTDGNTNGNNWKRYAFTIDGKTYSTFDEHIGSEFKEGDKVKMNGYQDGKYWNMKTMEIDDGTAVTETEKPGVSNETLEAIKVGNNLLAEMLVELKKMGLDHGNN
jgi:hypothetical protein